MITLLQDIRKILRDAANEVQLRNNQVNQIKAVLSGQIEPMKRIVIQFRESSEQAQSLANDRYKTVDDGLKQAKKQIKQLSIYLQAALSGREKILEILQEQKNQDIALLNESAINLQTLRQNMKILIMMFIVASVCSIITLSCPLVKEKTEVYSHQDPNCITKNCTEYLSEVQFERFETKADWMFISTGVISLLFSLSIYAILISGCCCCCYQKHGGYYKTTIANKKESVRLLYVQKMALVEVQI